VAAPIADVVVIPEDRNGHIDIARLEAELIRYQDGKGLAGESVRRSSAMSTPNG
jgi:hypothetical protein